MDKAKPKHKGNKPHKAPPKKASPTMPPVPPVPPIAPMAKPAPINAGMATKGTFATAMPKDRSDKAKY